MTVLRSSLIVLLMFLLSPVISSKPQPQHSQGGMIFRWSQEWKRKWDNFVFHIDHRFPQFQIVAQLQSLQRKIDLLTSLLKFPPNKYFIEATYHSLVYKDVYYPKEHVLPGEFYNTYYSSFANILGRRGGDISHQRPRPTHLGGQLISNTEIIAMKEIRVFISILKSNIENNNQNSIGYVDKRHEEDMQFIRSFEISSYNEISEWLWKCTDIDIIRFLRKHSNNSKKAFIKIIAHAQWRISYPNGADHILKENNYKDSMKLHEEVFWLDSLDKNNCPTVVVRALLHDGDNYDEIPQRFTNFLVLLLEQSRENLHVGSEKMACLVLDRFPLVSIDGSIKSQEIFDLSIVPNIIALLSNIVETMQDNYPEIFESITVTPASWFFQTCFRITSKVFDKKIRDRFHLIPEKDATAYLNDLFPDGKLSQLVISDINEVKGDIANHDKTSSSSSSSSDGLVFETTWLSNLVAMTLLETSIYFMWQAKEYMSCYYVFDVKRCTSIGTGKKFQKVRSRDVMTF